MKATLFSVEGIIKFIYLQSIFPALGGKSTGAQTVKIITERIPLSEMVSKTGPMIRLAGLCGATAVILGAYGSHRLYPDPKEYDKDLRAVFETANRYHFIHSLALLATPLCRSPRLVRSQILRCVGLFVFCLIFCFRVQHF